MDCPFLQISKKEISKKPEQLLTTRHNALQHSKNNVTKNCSLPLLESKSVRVKVAKRPQQLDIVLPPLYKSQQKTQQHGAPLVRDQLGQGFSKQNSHSQHKQKVDKEKSFDRQLPMSSTYVLEVFKKCLTKFEQEEIKDYSQVWYLGQGAQKIQGTDYLSCNSGYDTEGGFYRAVIKDHIAYRFEVLAVIDTGSFGQVLKCLDHKTKELVAIKVIRNQERVKRSVMAEVKILEALRKKDQTNTANILHMKEHFHFRSHLCISFELLGKDLYTMIKENKFQGLSMSQVKRYAIDLLKCLQLLKRERIIHSDLKPENILLSSEGHEHVKVIDFGASCFEENSSRACVQTLFYMSPEVILGKANNTAIDMWSLGCILAELHTGCPLFDGLDLYDQFSCIMEVLGVPPETVLQDAPMRNKLFDSAGLPRHTVNSEGETRLPGSKSLTWILDTKDVKFLDFILRCLHYDPEERMTPEGAMQHPWIQEELQRQSRPKTCAADKIGSATTAHLNNKESSLLKRQKMPPVRLPPIREKKVPEVKANGKYSVQNRTAATLQTKKEREIVSNSRREDIHFPAVGTGKERKGRKERGGA